MAIHDVARAISSSVVEGQLEGGIATGLGYALYENMALKEQSEWVDNFLKNISFPLRKICHKILIVFSWKYLNLVVRMAQRGLVKFKWFPPHPLLLMLFTMPLAYR